MHITGLSLEIICVSAHSMTGDALSLTSLASLTSLTSFILAHSTILLILAEPFLPAQAEL